MDIKASTSVPGDLTSTMESVLTNEDHDKMTNENESVSVGDSVPSSSSDANLKATVADTSQDDPISSTSDTINAENQNLNVTSAMELATNARNIESVSDSYFFSTELNMASISTEKISEDVEDIANDLENLLGEANNDYISSNSEKSFKIMSNERIDLVIKMGSDAAVLQNTSMSMPAVVEQLELPNLDETNQEKFSKEIISGMTCDHTEKIHGFTSETLQSDSEQFNEQGETIVSQSLDGDKQFVDASSDCAVYVEDDSKIVESIIEEKKCLEDTEKIGLADAEIKVPFVETEERNIAVKELERSNIENIPVKDVPIIEEFSLQNDIIVDAAENQDVDNKRSSKIDDDFQTNLENNDLSLNEGDKERGSTPQEKCVTETIGESNIDVASTNPNIDAVTTELNTGEVTESESNEYNESITVASKSQDDGVQLVKIEELHDEHDENEFPKIHDVKQDILQHETVETSIQKDLQAMNIEFDQERSHVQKYLFDTGVQNADIDQDNAQQVETTNLLKTEILQVDVIEGIPNKADSSSPIVRNLNTQIQIHQDINKVDELIEDNSTAFIVASNEIKNKPDDNLIFNNEQDRSQEGKRLIDEDVLHTEINTGKFENIPQLKETELIDETNEGAQMKETTLQVPDIDTSVKSLETISNIVSEMQETLMNLDRTDQLSALLPENSSSESMIESTHIQELSELSPENSVMIELNKCEESSGSLLEELRDLLPINSVSKSITDSAEVEELSVLSPDNTSGELVNESARVDELSDLLPETSMIELAKDEKSSELLLENPTTDLVIEPIKFQKLKDLLPENAASKPIIESSIVKESSETLECSASEPMIESTETSSMSNLENFDISSTAIGGIEESTSKRKLTEDICVEEESPSKKLKPAELQKHVSACGPIIGEGVKEAENQEANLPKHLYESTVDTFELESNYEVTEEPKEIPVEQTISSEKNKFGETHLQLMEEQGGNFELVEHLKDNLDINLDEQTIVKLAEFTEETDVQHINYDNSGVNLDNQQFTNLEEGIEDKSDNCEDQQITKLLEFTEPTMQLESTLTINVQEETRNVEQLSHHKSDDDLDNQQIPMFSESIETGALETHLELDNQQITKVAQCADKTEHDQHINHNKSDVSDDHQITNFPGSTETENAHLEQHTTKEDNLVEQQIINLMELAKDPVEADLEKLLVKNTHADLDGQQKEMAETSKFAEKAELEYLVEEKSDIVDQQIQQLLETAEVAELKVAPDVYVQSEEITKYMDSKQESENVELDELLIEPNIELIDKEEIEYKGIELTMADTHIQLLGLQESVSITENEISEQIDLLMEKQCELQETTIEITQIQEEFDQNIELCAIIEEQIPLIDSTKKQDLYDAEPVDDVLTIEEISMSEIEQSGIEELKRTCIVVEPDDEIIDDHVEFQNEVEMVEVGKDDTLKTIKEVDDDKFENLEFTQRDLIEDTIDAITKTSDDKFIKTNLEVHDIVKEDPTSKLGFVSEAITSPKFELETPLIIQVEDSAAEGKPSSENKDVHETKAVSKYSSKMSANQDLKMTITKHKGCKDDARNKLDSGHSILKIYDPAEKIQQSKESTVPKLIIKPVLRTSCKNEESEQTVPKITIKPIVERSDSQHSPKLIIKNLSPNRPASPKVVKVQKSEMLSPLKLTIKPVFKSDDNQLKMSPKTRSMKQDDENVKITIKPIVRPAQDEESSHNPKITIKPVIKPEESSETSPRITIKPIVKPDESGEYEAEASHSPRITIKPIMKPPEESLEVPHSPRITIKPIVKPQEESKDQDEEILRSPRITIKPIMKPSDEPKPDDILHSPRITIKPIVKPHEDTKQDSAGSPKITIKPIRHPDGENNSVELIDFEDQIKQERIVLKINKSTMGKELRKREASEEIEKLGKIKLKFSKEGGHAHIVSEQGKLKRALEGNCDAETKRTRFDTGDLTITPIEVGDEKKERVETVKGNSLDISVVSTQLDDPLEKIPIFEITPESAAVMKNIVPAVSAQPVVPTPRKRGRPRKVPLVVREEFKDVKEEEAPPPPLISEETGRPKRSCRGPSVRTTLGIRTRRPRGSSRGRGRGRGSRGGGSRGGRQQRVSAAKLKLLKEEAAAAIAEHSKNLDTDVGDVEMKDEQSEDVSTRTSDIVLIEEETRMSAEINNSRAQTPAKQVSTPGDVEDTQSSVQSTATTESVKVRKGPRMDVHQEPEGEVISAEQLAEYYWGGGGPFMLQEQVAQFLGIKSFKRKYPGINRRPVEMQERDFIRESGLASEAMCDLGLTCVNSADILDIMYSDFQNKYEEYCKHQRDRQAKDFTNKQKALSLAASQEKNKLDITQQAVQSAAAWNLTFNKARKEERKACMDLQTFTVHYPRGRFANTEKQKVGHYPVALVPGQFTDYYKTFTPTELNNLPLNTMLYNPINAHHDDSHSDGSGSDSDSSSSDSDSSSSDSSDDDCNVCSPASSTTKKVIAN